MRPDRNYRPSHRRPERPPLRLHCAPVWATVEGEPCELIPSPGSSQLEEPLNRFGVAVAFHGHAHAGAPEGKTAKGTPVYNVAVPVLRKHYPDRPTFRVFEVERGTE